MAVRVKRNGGWVSVSGVPDTTLTKPGQAADAAATGAMFEKLGGMQEQKQIVSIDFTNWDLNAFTITYKDGSVSTFEVYFDDQDRPTEITDDAGNVINIYW